MTFAQEGLFSYGLRIPRLNFVILKFLGELQHSLLHKDIKLLERLK